MEENETQHHPADQTVGPRAKHGQVGETRLARIEGNPKTSNKYNPQYSRIPFSTYLIGDFFLAAHLVRLNLPFEWW